MSLRVMGPSYVIIWKIIWDQQLIYRKLFRQENMIKSLIFMNQNYTNK